MKSITSDYFRDDITKQKLTASQRRSFYKRAWEQNNIQAMKDLALDYVITSEFVFMKELYLQKVSENKFHQLPLPAFSTDGENFKSVVEKIARYNFKTGLLKSFGHQTNEYGTVFLNNTYYLTCIFPLSEINFDEIVNWDHTKILSGRTAMQILNRLNDVKMRYTKKRLFTVLTNANPNQIVDADMMLSMCENRAGVIERLPRKPKSFQELHDAISELTMTVKKENRPLNQDIIYLDGLPLMEFTIEVPKETVDLVATSEELKHCVHGYDELVITKKAQILNLMKGHNRIYTIELRPEGESYVVKQFKGYRNDPTMEGPNGYSYITELIKLINKVKQID